MNQVNCIKNIRRSRRSIMVSIQRCGRWDPGSIPGVGKWPSFLRPLFVRSKFSNLFSMKNFIRSTFSYYKSLFIHCFNMYQKDRFEITSRHGQNIFRHRNPEITKRVEGAKWRKWKIVRTF